jgi:hypothetical protein
MWEKEALQEPERHATGKFRIMIISVRRATTLRVFKPLVSLLFSKINSGLSEPGLCVRISEEPFRASSRKVRSYNGYPLRWRMLLINKMACYGLDDWGSSLYIISRLILRLTWFAIERVRSFLREYRGRREMTTRLRLVSTLRMHRNVSLLPRPLFFPRRCWDIIKEI